MTMNKKILILPLAIAAVLTQSAAFAQEANAIANYGTICTGPVNITQSASINVTPDNASGFKFKSDHTPRTLPFTIGIVGRGANDIVTLSNASVTLTGGPGCKLDVLNPVYLTLMPVAGEPGILQASGQLQLAAGADTVAGTGRGTTYTCALQARFNPPTTITDIAPNCGTVTQTLYAIQLSFLWYRQ
ncbi:MAG: hypothetical protein JSU00_30905 [Acidobacteria bacterium]|nr:hypothetical protein [Acidobacteriota bacterium]